MKAALAMAALVTLGAGSTYLAQEPTISTLQPPMEIVQVEDTVSQLEKARSSVFAIMLNEEKSGGSAILVGRQKLENGNYRYRAITAFHVVDSLAKRIREQGATANRSLTMLFQPTFHGQPLRAIVEIDDIDWAVPAHDWGSFTFELPHKLHCSTLATEAEFKAVKFTDRIYMVGCGGLFGPHVREGIMGSTHNHHVITNLAIRPADRPWRVNPNRYFKPSMPIARGDSGGAIFSKDGKLLGIANAFSIYDRYSGWVNHSGVALKAHAILDVTQHAQDFFLVED